AKTGRI
ncbi:unnamed protein product, partial [Allacma fusca]